jgi:hypothetical protein
MEDRRLKMADPQSSNFVQKGLALAQSLVKSAYTQAGVGEGKVIGFIPAYSDFASNTVK